MMFVLAMTGGIAASSVGPAAETEGEHAANSRPAKIIMGKSLVFILSTPSLRVLTTNLPILYYFPAKVGVD
jgi:hypothetical protein